MSEQLVIDCRPADLATARAVGQVAQELATDRAERDAPGFRERVRDAVLDRLAQGPASGEELTDYVAAQGIPFADGRSLGGIYRSMKDGGLIRVVPGVDVPRKHGHGTSGGRLWERC